MIRILKSVLSLILLLDCIVCDFPCMEKVETVKNEIVSEYSESDNIVYGYGDRIKEKKQKKAKVNVNKKNDNGKLWNQQMIHSVGVEESKKTVKIAIIDSGINFSTDLIVVARKNFIFEDERNILYEDSTGHGTAVAGIIGALDNEEGITGINPGVELYSARVLDDKLEAPVERIVEAIDWAIVQNVDIINMSFGISKNVSELESAVKRAAEAGILLVAAVGNGEKIAYPAAYNEVIAVGSVTAEGIPSENSAKGEELELMAPGDNILSSGIFGGVTGNSGTSMAVPHVVGAASVLMELNPEMSADYIRALLNYSANLYGSSSEYGNGVIDLEYAIEINDKFKELYEKSVAKETKKGNQKEKQKEKFWDEVLKIIPENEKAVETFMEVDIVEGMWLKDNSNHEGDTHEDFVYDGIVGTQMNFTSEQMAIITYACCYPDTSGSGLNDMDDNPYHGFLWERQKIISNGKTTYSPKYNSNYIANYIFLTKVARAYGNASSIPIGYMFQNDYNRIVEDFTTNRLGTKSWTQVFDLMNTVKGTDIAANAENIKLFIYGIAIHSISDIFAHSAWANQGGWRRVNHNSDWNNNADNPNYFPMRYTMAQIAVQSALTKAYYGSEGLLTDFVLPSAYFGTFYLGNFAPYAKAVNAQAYNSITSAFERGDLDKNIVEYNYEGNTYYAN